MNSDNLPVSALGTDGLPLLNPLAGMLRRKTDLLRHADLRQSPGAAVRVGVIGFGYWGPNIVRNLHSLEHCEVVAVLTPVWTHFELAKAALKNGKHVFVEKPLTSTAAQAEELIELADRKNLRIMVDHTFLFSGAVRKIRELIDHDVLGTLYYYDSTRVN